jgi:hypothetical protein
VRGVSDDGKAARALAQPYGGRCSYTCVLRARHRVSSPTQQEYENPCAHLSAAEYAKQTGGASSDLWAVACVASALGRIGLLHLKDLFLGVAANLVGAKCAGTNRTRSTYIVVMTRPIQWVIAYHPYDLCRPARGLRHLEHAPQSFQTVSEIRKRALISAFQRHSFRST